MRASGPRLPWQSCANPPATPRATCACDTTPTQAFVMCLLLPTTVGGGSVRSCQQSSGNGLAPPPLREQAGARPREALAEGRPLDDAVRAEGAEVAPRLAPGHHHPHALEEREGQGPDGAMGGATLAIRV